MTRSMRFSALACDYDGTLANEGQVDRDTAVALRRLSDTGRRLILITGRELEELLVVFPDVHLFDAVVAENGAVLYSPAEQRERLLATPPPAEFVSALQNQGVRPLSVGRVIVATKRAQAERVLNTIFHQKLDLQVIFNKTALMVLPSSINKATGLREALSDLGLTASNVVGVGDAENDRDFLRVCGRSVAVANALAIIQREVDWVTPGRNGAGVMELIKELVENDLVNITTRERRSD